MKRFLVLLASGLTIALQTTTMSRSVVVVSAYSASAPNHSNHGGGGGGSSSSSGSGKSHGRRPFIRKQDIYGVWRLTHHNMQFPKAPIKVETTTSSSSNSRPPSMNRFPMKEFTVYPKTTSSSVVAEQQQQQQQLQQEEEEIVIRLNDDGSFDQYTPTAEGDDGDDDNEENIATSSSSSSSPVAAMSHDLQNVLGRGGAWEYFEQDGKIILAPGRPVDADGLKVHDTLLTGQLDVQVSECLPTSDLDQTTQLPDTPDTGDLDIEVRLGQQQQQQDDHQDSNHPSIAANNDDKNINNNPAGETSQDETREIDVHLSIPQGNVSIGKFMYPRKHKAFFDDPMLFSESSIGTFSMKQLLGNLNARLRHEGDDDDDDEFVKEQKRIDRKKYHKRDFYGRKFYLTATPHPVNPKYAKEDKRFDEKSHKTRITVMPIEFFSNNTFTATGAEKILRGRYGTTGENGDRLWFQVTLFGFGRKKGHVYSEGRLLSHDDRRGYLGQIIEYPAHKTPDEPSEDISGDAKMTTERSNEQTPSRTDLSGGVLSDGSKNQNHTKFFVEGDFYYGGWQAGRANSFGTFTLQEIDNDETDGMEDDYEEEDEEDRRQQEFIDQLEHLMTNNEGEDEDAFQ